jgi:Uncharacterized protein conserved in bacteria (DUF2213)
MPLRFDARQSLVWEKLTGDRYLAHSVLGKAGLPLKYYHWDGKGWRNRIETVRRDDLFNDDSLLSARAIPLVLGHPKSGRYDNNKEGLLVGHTFDSFLREDDQLIMPVVVDDIRGVRIINDAIASGLMAEVSPGYSITGLERQNDIFYQIGRRYDHLALLSPGEGRGGQAISLRTDSQDDIAGAETQFFFVGEVSKKQNNNLELEGELSPSRTKKGGTKLKVKLDGKEFEIEDAELALAIERTNTRIDSLTSEKDALTADKSKVEGELAGIKTRLDAAESSKPTEDAIAVDIQERLDTWVSVLPALRTDKKDFQPDYKLTPTEIKQLYLKAKHPDIKLDGKDAAYVDGLWDALKPALKSTDEEAIDRTDALLEQLNRADAAPKDEKDDPLMNKIRDRYRNAHKTKSGAMN